MDFTREPIIETVITPREGHKLVVRSSKGGGQEEYFVDAVEVVSFGNAFFFRSIEKPKSFLLPVIDYEVLEVREARMVLKHVGLDRSIKISGGRQAAVRADKKEEQQPEEKLKTAEKKREKRRQYRRRRGRDEKTETETKEESQAEERAESKKENKRSVKLPDPKSLEEKTPKTETGETAAGILRSILSPPPLISETIGRYKKEVEELTVAKPAPHTELNPRVELAPKQEANAEPKADQTPPQKNPHTEDLWDFSEELTNDHR